MKCTLCRFRKPRAAGNDGYDCGIKLPRGYEPHGVRYVPPEYGCDLGQPIIPLKECYAENGAPIKCFRCGSTQQKEVVRSVIDVIDGKGPVCEYEVFCADCGQGIGYWAYGYFDPAYFNNMPNIKKVKPEPTTVVLPKCFRKFTQTLASSRDCLICEHLKSCVKESE